MLFLPLLDADCPEDVVLVAQGPRRADITTGGYADDTEAVAPDAAALQWLASTMERRLRLTGQEVNVGKWEGAAPMRLLGAPIPVEEELRWLGVGIRVWPEWGTGPLLQGRMEGGASVLTHMPQLATFDRR